MVRLTHENGEVTRNGEVDWNGGLSGYKIDIANALAVRSACLKNQGGYKKVVQAISRQNKSLDRVKHPH